MPVTRGSGQFGPQVATKAHLVAGSGGIPGEIADLRADIKRDFANNAAIAVEEFTDVPAATVNAIKTSFASANTAQDFSGSALNGSVGVGTMSPPRNITITTTANANIDAVGVVVTGKDVNGKDLSETITLTDGGGVTNAGTKAFASVSRIQIPAQGGSGGSIQVGFGNLMGLGKPIKTRAGFLCVMGEIIPSTGRLAADAVTGTFANTTVGAPNGTYSPAAAANGTNDYAVYYEYDATLNT